MMCFTSGIFNQFKSLERKLLKQMTLFHHTSATSFFFSFFCECNKVQFPYTEFHLTAFAATDIHDSWHTKNTNLYRYFQHFATLQIKIAQIFVHWIGVKKKKHWPTNAPKRNNFQYRYSSPSSWTYLLVWHFEMLKKSQRLICRKGNTHTNLL